MILGSETVSLGRTGLRVTRLGLGMRPLGELPAGQEEAGRAVLLGAAGLGLRLLDTAPTYGKGESERRLGQVLSAVPSSMVISTKVGKVLEPGSLRQVLSETIAAGPATAVRLPQKAARALRRRLRRDQRAGLIPPSVRADYSYDGAMRSIEGSLARIGADRLDIVLIHDPENHIDEAMTGAYRALDRLRSEGVVTAIGIGINHWQPLIRLADEGDFDCFLLAGRYSLLDQGAAEHLLPLARERGISIIIGGVFNGGLLADPERYASFDYAPASPARLDQALVLKKACDRHGVNLKAAALQFPFGHPAVTSVLIGAASVAELEEGERLLRSPIPASLWAELRDEGLVAPTAVLPD